MSISDSPNNSERQKALGLLTLFYLTKKLRHSGLSTITRDRVRTHHKAGIRPQILTLPVLVPAPSWPSPTTMLVTTWTPPPQETGDTSYPSGHPLIQPPASIKRRSINIPSTEQTTESGKTKDVTPEGQVSLSPPLGKSGTNPNGFTWCLSAGRVCRDLRVWAGLQKVHQSLALCTILLFWCGHVFRERAKTFIRNSTGATNQQNWGPVRCNYFCPVVNGGQWAELGPEPRSPPLYPGVFSFLQTCHHVAYLCPRHGPWMLHFYSSEGWSDSFTALLDFVFHRPQFFVMVKYFWRDLDPFL